MSHAKVRHDPLCPSVELGGWGVFRCDLIEKVVQLEKNRFMHLLLDEVERKLDGGKKETDLTG